MTIMQAFWLGAVQGLTEFLPISSSGHLLLLQELFGISAESNLLAILLHVGTLIAVVAVYWNRLINMLLHPIKSELWLLVVATLPAVASALLFKEMAVQMQIQLLGYSFLLTTLVLWFSDLIGSVAPQHKEVKWYNALVMGLMQGIAAQFSGLSRSGSTIAGGVFTGLSRKRSADFAFLMAVPAILGALVLNLKDLIGGEVAIVAENPLPVVVGMVTSVLFGLIAIKGMLAIVRRIRLSWFGLYTGILGILILLDQHFLHFFFK